MIPEILESDIKLVVEWLGLCWHENVTAFPEDSFWKCECGKIIPVFTEPYPAPLSPDFQQLILDEGPKNRRWDKFIWELWEKRGWPEYDNPNTIPFDYLSPCGNLFKALLEFIKERE